MTVAEQVTLARAASYKLAVLPTETKNRGLLRMAEILLGAQDAVLEANSLDGDAARASGLGESLYKRLLLNERKLQVMADSLRSVAALRDPVGEVLLRRELDIGLELGKVRVPIGVIGVIFESRPDALVQIASLAVKSGNAVILKGGSEAKETNRLLHSLFVRALSETDPAFDGAVALVESREEIGAVLTMDGQIDLMIPRGSSELVRYIQDNTRIPVLGHADGVCHLYVDETADPGMAVRLTVDSKTQYPAVCNALETLLIHESRTDILPDLAHALKGVELRGCAETRRHIDAAAADELDWSAEYNDLVLAIRVIPSLDAAVNHINRYGSHHTDAIVTADRACAEAFLSRVDSSSVLWNASTRFADGFRYGLGAEVGISTGKVHARGPVGLEGLTTTKYRVVGEGHIVADYADGTKEFTHRDLS
ncbi:MAG: glutamate-5-semialdehyde dehydrogenase [Spirochaetia bacterium]